MCIMADTPDISLWLIKNRSDDYKSKTRVCGNSCGDLGKNALAQSSAKGSNLTTR